MPAITGWARLRCWNDSLVEVMPRSIRISAPIGRQISQSAISRISRMNSMLVPPFPATYTAA